MISRKKNVYRLTAIFAIATILLGCATQNGPAQGSQASSAPDPTAGAASNSQGFSQGLDMSATEATQ